ncbi:MAG: ATP synthase F1 subunit delta [Syntrophaceae bacterium]|nr:ATP synthase F1 subunit delta [Syntrophaceae bacterium]
MITSTLAKRYARAFFEIAEEEKQYETYYSELSLFAAIMKGHGELRAFLSNPAVDQPGKKAVVEALLTKLQVSPLTANFLKLLVDKRRIGILSEIQKNYQELMDRTLKKARISVKTAFPLSVALSARLREGLEQMTGKQVEMTVQEDASLLGGLVVQVGDTLYDGSIRTQLNNIRNLLGEEK